jgi:hypothetical protein
MEFAPGTAIAIDVYLYRSPAAELTRLTVG